MWVKKYWYVVLILGWVGVCWTDIGKETIKRKIWTEANQLKSSATQVADTSQSKINSVRQK